MTHGQGKSDRPVVPEKSPNKAGQPVAEGMEGRGLAKGNLPQQNASRTPSREDAPSALERVRQAAGKDKKLRFTALLHHIYNLETLRKAYFRLKKEAAPGVDGETWRHYGETLGENLQDLSERLKRGAYRAKPVRRVYIAKADGRQRPLGVPALEDKIVQRATVEVLNAIYETDLLGFSYGFRPGRSQHNALDDFVFQCGNSERSFPPVILVDVHSTHRLGSIRSPLQPMGEVLEIIFEGLAVVPPRLSIHPGRSFLLQTEVGRA